MAFVGNTELVLFEIGLVGFVGFLVPTFIRSFLAPGIKYDTLVRNTSWAPSYWVFMLLLAATFLVLEPLAVYRIRLLGNWVSGVNLGALVVFWILQIMLVLYNTFMSNWLWFAFLFMLLAFALAIATTWMFFVLDTFAGVLMIMVDIILFYLMIVSLVIAFRNGTGDAAVCYAKRQATWNNQIGANLPPAQRRQNVTTVRTVKMGAKMTGDGGAAPVRHATTAFDV